MRLPPTSPHASGHSLGQRVWTAGRWALLLAGLAATYSVFLFTSMRITIKAREVTVPNVHGKPVEEATSALESMGLTVLLDPLRRFDGQVPANHVLTQEPAAGSVIRRQRPVRIRVSDGAQASAVPSLSGESERTAQILVAQNNVKLVYTSQIQSGDYPPGVVVAQDPPAKSRGSNVSLLINRGEAGVTYVMPDLIGSSGARVAEILRRRLFRVTIVGEVPYPGLPSGTVVRQTPQAGFQLAPGDPITLEISR